MTQGSRLLGELKDGRDAARLYLFLMIPILLTLNIVFVPFHAPDDYDHLKRAYTLEHGAIWPTKLADGSIGSYIDEQLLQAVDEQRPVVIQWPRIGNVPPDSSTAPKKLDGHWTGKQVYNEFGAALYLPFVYVPQAAV